MKNAVITGVASTRVGDLEGSTCLGLHTEAALDAAANAGLKLADIDGVLCAYSLVEPQVMLSSAFCEYAGLQPRYSTTVSMGGVTAAQLVMHAAMLVESGRCRHVLIATGDNRLSGLRGKGVATIAATGTNAQHEYIYGLGVPAAYALVARRYMHEYGLTSEHLAAIAVTQRKHAGRHPLAHYRKPVTLEDVMASRIIASPLRLLDCCPMSDGGAAVIVSAPDAARDAAKPRIGVLGAGQGHTHEHLIAAPSLTEFGCKQAAGEAMGQAGVTPSDFDVVEIYDSFTITLAVELESMGFFQKGEAGPAALAGELDLGGKLPCNTHGGLLSYGHSGAAGGLFHFVEAVQQLRGEAGERQVAGAELALVHGDGGILSGHCSIVLGRQ